MKNDILEYFESNLFSLNIRCVDFKKLEIYLVNKNYELSKIAQELNKIKQNYFYQSRQQGSNLSIGLSPPANHNFNLYCIRAEKIELLKSYLNGVLE